MKKVFTLLFLGTFFSNYAQTDEGTPVKDTLIMAAESTAKVQPDDKTLLFWHGRRFRVSAGVYFPLNNTQIEVGSKNGNFGTTVDLEDDLGFSKNTVSWMAAAQWRISRRSRLDLEYFYLNRESSHRLDRDIEFGDHTYPVDATITAFFNMKIARLAYGYAFVSKPKYEIGALIGAHTLFADVGLNLDTRIGEAEVHDNFKFTAPLPDVGLWGEVVLTQKLGLFANINYLALKIGDIKGRIISSNLALSYNVYHNLNFTLGYTGLHFRVDVEKERLKGFFKWGYNGPLLTANYAFGGHVRFEKKRK